MAIEKAESKYNNETIVFEATNYLSNDLYKNTKNNLECAESECTCKLVFVNKLNNPHFRKHPKDYHSRNCIFSTDVNLTRNRNIIYEQIESGVSDKYIHNKLKNAGKKLIDSKTGKAKKEKKLVNKDRTKIDNRSKTQEVTGVSIKMSEEENPNLKEKRVRRQPIREYNINSLDIKNSSKIITYTDIINEIIITNDNDFTIISKDKEIIVEINLSEAYFASTNIITVKKALRSLSRIITNSKIDFYISILGEFEYKEGKYIFNVNSYNALEILFSEKNIVISKKPDDLIAYMSRKNM